MSTREEQRIRKNIDLIKKAIGATYTQTKITPEKAEDIRNDFKNILSEYEEMLEEVQKNKLS